MGVVVAGARGARITITLLLSLTFLESSQQSFALVFFPFSRTVRAAVPPLFWSGDGGILFAHQDGRSRRSVATDLFSGSNPEFIAWTSSRRVHDKSAVVRCALKQDLVFTVVQRTR